MTQVKPNIPKHKLENVEITRQPIIKLSWETIHNAVDSLAYEVSYLQPSLIIGIARGGLIPATMLSHRLNVPMKYVSAQSYEGTRRTLQKPTEIEGIKTEWFRAHSHQRVLVVDDVIDTGETYEAIKRELSLIPYVAIVNKRPLLYQSYYFCNVPPGVWVKFPWELEHHGS